MSVIPATVGLPVTSAGDVEVVTVTDGTVVAPATVGRKTKAPWSSEAGPIRTLWLPATVHPLSPLSTIGFQWICYGVMSIASTLEMPVRERRCVAETYPIFRTAMM